MLLIEYIRSVYGPKRGNKAAFLRDNPEILPQELSRWLKNDYKVHLDSGDIYKPVSRKVIVKKIPKISN